MNYQITKIPDVPLVMVRANQNFGDAASVKAYAQDLKALYDSLDAPVYQIADLTDFNLNFDELVSAFQIVMRGENSIVRHPNNLGLLVVTHNRFYEIALRGLNTATFGYVEILTFATVEAAMSWVKDRVRLPEHLGAMHHGGVSST